jgi:hypothetical protein
MANMEEKKYEQDGKTIKIVPVKKVKKTEGKTYTQDGETVKIVPVKRAKKTEEEKGLPKFAVGDRVSLKNIPPEYSGAGLAESVIMKVFKSSHDQKYRYSIKSTSGHVMEMVKEEQLKPRKINFKK